MDTKAPIPGGIIFYEGKKRNHTKRSTALHVIIKEVKTFSLQNLSWIYISPNKK